MSGVYIGVDGKARKVKGGYVGVDGVARKIKKAYIGVDGIARLCYIDNPYDPVFANNTWEQVAEACRTRQVPDTWSVGDQKTMTIDGTDYLIDIIGKDHDDYADGSGKAPLTFQLHNCYFTKYSMNDTASNSCKWTNCHIRSKHIPTILTLMPINIQEFIKSVNKKTAIGYNNSSLEITVDKLFLLAETEVFGVKTYSHDGEGTQYDYYVNGYDKIKTLNGNINGWWLRSPAINSSSFCIVSDNGSQKFSAATTLNGVSFAFCF